MHKMCFNRAKVFSPLQPSFVCFLCQKPALLVNTQIHITKQPAFYSSTRKKLFIAQINVPCGTFICTTNKILQIHRRLIIAFFAARNCRNPIFVTMWNLLHTPHLAHITLYSSYHIIFPPPPPSSFTRMSSHHLDDDPFSIDYSLEFLLPLTSAANLVGMAMQATRPLAVCCLVLDPTNKTMPPFHSLLRSM
jgi:hypothetical protein